MIVPVRVSSGFFKANIPPADAPGDATVRGAWSPLFTARLVDAYLA